MSVPFSYLVGDLCVMQCVDDTYKMNGKVAFMCHSNCKEIILVIFNAVALQIKWILRFINGAQVLRRAYRNNRGHR